MADVARNLIRGCAGAILLISAAVSAQAEEPLPRVLIIGDSVYRDMSRAIASQLKEQAEVVYVTVPPGEVHHTTAVLEHLDVMLGDRNWDVIHFNSGLGDLAYRTPGMESFRLLPIHVGGVRSTTPEQYEVNLQKLVDRLKQTEANLIWASTTPIRHSSTNVFELESEIAYNTIAARVMAKNEVAVNDMYSFVLEQIDMDRPAAHGADPFFFDRQPIHRQVVDVLRVSLGLPIASIEDVRDDLP